MAVFGAYPIPAVSYSYITTYYRALATLAANYSIGDVIRQVAQINNNTGALTGVSNWYNVDTDTALAAAPAAADIEALDKNRIALTALPLVVSNVAAGVGLPTIPATANYAEVHVWNADISLTLDGTAPTAAGTGFRQANGQTFELESRDEITKWKGIRLGTVDANLWVQYFQAFGDYTQQG